MGTKTKNGIKTATAWLVILSLVGRFAFALINGSTLRQLTNGRLDDVDFCPYQDGSRFTGSRRPRRACQSGARTTPF
jgi:hypothetical protein